MMERTTQFSHEGLRFPAHDEGPLDGPAVILLHGFPEDASCWERVVPLLHDAGLRTLRFDQRGYSPTARPARVAEYSLPHLTGDVLALADAAGLSRFHLVGHDWGGGVAWQLAADHPGRVASLTVLATPHPSALLRALRHRDQLRRSWYMAAFQLPRLPERWLAPRLAQSLVHGGLADADAQAIAVRLGRPTDLTGPINWYRALAPWHGQLRPLATGAVQVPTTYLWGNEDRALGREAAEATAGFVTADYHFQELDAGHWLPEQFPGPVAEAVVERTRG